MVREKKIAGHNSLRFPGFPPGLPEVGGNRRDLQEGGFDDLPLAQSLPGFGALERRTAESIGDLVGENDVDISGVRSGLAHAASYHGTSTKATDVVVSRS